MRRVVRPLATLFAAIAVLVSALVPAADAQNFDEIVQELEENGYYIEPGAEGSDSRFRSLVEQADATGDTWYFVSLAGSVSGSMGDDLFESLSPQGNVLLYFLDSQGFANVQLASDDSVSSSVQDRALEAFDTDWDEPEDFMEEVVADFTALTSSSSGSSSSAGSGGTDSGSSRSDTSGSGGGGFPWGWVLIPLLLIGGFWFMSRRGKKKHDDDNLATAQKIRAELQTELDELANDVLVLSAPVDVADNDQVTTYYREATDTYLDISEDLPDLEQLAQADLRELSELGARVAQARWQMDAAEAIMDGEPVPEKPKVEPPPPTKPPRSDPRPRARQLPQRQPRPRVPYSRSRRRSGGGLLDILIAGAGMMGGRSRGRSGGMFGGGGSSRGRSGGMFGGGGSSRGRSGGMFGGGGSSRGRSRSNQPRPGGGVFGGGSSSRGRSSRSGRSTRSSRSSSGRRSRSSARRSRSTSRRRIR